MQSQPRIIVNSREESDSLLKTHKVLRNTYFLLALTLAFSSIVAAISMSLNLPRPGLIMMLAGFYGLLFLTHKFADSGLGILATFAFTGFLGYTVGPILNVYVGAGLSDLVVLALGGTAAYVLTTKKDMSFLSGMLFALFIVLLVGMIASFFFNLPALHVALSGLFVIFSSAAILYETSNIIHGGETNYIRATVSLFVSIYNLFISLLNLLSFLRDE